MSSRTQALARQEWIVQQLLSHQVAEVTELAASLNVSTWTVRRDLEALSERGLITRRYGQAALADGADYQSFIVPPERSEQLRPGKLAIGRAAAHLIQPGQHVVLSAGSTTLEVARALKDRDVHCRVVTNALNIAQELAAARQVRVTCSGGEVDGDYSTLNGPIAERMLGSYYFDLAIVGVSGVALREGLTVNSQLNAVAVDTMLEHAKRVVVVADARKFGEVRFARLGDLNRMDVLVTDAPLSTEFSERLKSERIEVIVASSAPG